VGAAESTQVVWLDNGLVAAMLAQSLTVSSVSLGGPDAAAFRIVWDGCSGLVIGAAFSCPVAVGFDPTAGGTFNASLLFTDDAAGSPHAVALSGVVAGPGASLSAQQLAFFDVPVGQQSRTQQVTVTNTGNLALHVSSITAASPFVVSRDTCTGVAVAPGASCSVGVTFAPTSRGIFNVPLVITDDAPGSPQQVALSGQGVVPELSVSPASLDLGSQPVGSANISTQQLVTVTNTGLDRVDLASIAVSPGFAIGSQTCVGVLAPAASCTIGVYATPTAVGPETGQLTISSDAVGAPHTVALSAVGLGGVGSLSTTSVDYGSVRVRSKSAPVTITLTNAGNVPVEVGKLALSGTNKGDYTIKSETCQKQTLAPGSSCQVVIIFRPDSAGVRTATLTFTDSALNSPQMVSLTGTGVSR
jgi:archaellum component FlaF (FlaF/FlaG flagellin family)